MYCRKTPLRIFSVSKSHEKIDICVRPLKEQTQTTTKMLPKVFAVYRSDLETFQLFTTDADESGNLIRLKMWSKPTAENIENNPELKCWANGGQEYYVVPTYNQGSRIPPEIHSFILHGQIYSWWSLRHCLVWSDYLTHAQRYAETRDAWMTSPRISVLDFSSKLIYPRTLIETYPRWCDSSPKKLEMEVARGHESYKMQGDRPVLLNIQDHVDPKDLRIRTPQPRDDEEAESFTPDSNHRAQHYCPRPKSWSNVSEEIEIHLNGLIHPKDKCAQMTARSVLGFMATLFCVGTVLMLV